MSTTRLPKSRRSSYGLATEEHEKLTNSQDRIVSESAALCRHRSSFLLFPCNISCNELYDLNLKKREGNC
jgi:hypothetical protein